jgi:conjugative relaxase-like TrwC/TraI family protein
MLVMSKGALSAKQAESYYEEKYSQDDYYTEERRVVGRWFGNGATALGLSGEVRTEAFRAVLRGLHPATGQVLVQQAGGYDDRRAGWDATFNAPKSVSIQALLGEDGRLLEAHRSSVSRALVELERYALSRQRGGSEWVVTENIVAARFDHVAARPSPNSAEDGYGPDPHLHTHVVIANMTRRPDAAWRGLDPIEIYRSQTFASAVYRSELAHAVENLGYRISVRGADGRWELQGYSREQVMAFSRRRQDIEEELSRQGLNGAAAAQNVAHQTRGQKDLRDEQSLKAEWHVRAREYGISIERVASVASTRGAPGFGGREPISEAVRLSTAHNTEREAVVDRRALEVTALQHLMGVADVGQVRTESGRNEQTGELIRVGNAITYPQGAYTTREMVALERENIALMRDGLGRAAAIAPNDQVKSWAVKRGLLPDQAEAAEITICASDWVTAIEGRAGTAKTTTVGAIKEFAAEHGYLVRGFAPTTRAVKALSEAGLPARTVASLLENPIEPARKELWIIDESSLLATRQVNGLLRKARDAEVDRIVFVGDQRQHHAIEAGRPIYQMQRAGMAIARLETIRRQRDPGLRQSVVHVSSGRISEALSVLDQRGDIREIKGAKERYGAIAAEFVTAHRLGERVLVVSPSNEERRELNAAIRAALKQARLVSNEAAEQTIFVGRDLTRQQRGRAHNYEVGDIIRFTRGSRRQALEKDTYATVENVDRGRHSLTIRTSDGRAVEYFPSRLHGVAVLRPEQRAFSPGDRIQFRAPDRKLGVANGEFATIVAIDSRRTSLRMDDGREISAASERLRHIDHGYASTSHSSQGVTVDRVIVNVDTTRSAQLVNRKQFYVSISRARLAASIYTDDRDRLRQTVSRNREKSTALEVLQSKLSPEFKSVSDRILHSVNRVQEMRR